MITMSRMRPQATFLPLIAETGAVKPMYGASYYKTLEIQEKKAEEKRNAQMATATL